MAQQNEDPEAVPEDTETTRLDSSKDTSTEYEYVPPDGGWGWLVLGGSVMVSLLIPGTIKCFGILFVEFIDVFKATPVTASWIPALTYFLYCSLGPLASYLSTKYSYRTVTLLGGVFAATGMISSVFATNIVHLYICYGILVGTGAGLSFPPGVFIVTSYFVRLRGLANGVAISGSALGSIILPPFLRFLLETYGFRGAVLIMGGLILNVLVGASLYDPVQQHLKKIPLDPSKKNKHNSLYYVENTVEEKKNNESAKPPEEKAFLERVIHETCDVPVEVKEIILDNEISLPKKEFYMSSVNNQISDCGSNPVLKNGISHLSLSRPMTNSESVQQLSRKISTGSYRGRGSYLMGSTGQLGRKLSVVGPRPLPKVASSSAMSRKVSVTSNLSSSSFRYISTHFHGSTLVGLNPEFSSQSNIKATQQNTAPKPSCFSSLCRCFRSKKDVEIKVQNKTKGGVYRELLRDPAFIIILISNATTAIGYTNFTIMLPSYAISLGFDKDMSSYLLSVVSALDLVGRVGGSALSDWLPIDKKYYYIAGLFFSGISLMALPFAHSYSSLAFVCGAFGLASGTYVGITAIVIVELLGEDRLASSYGVSLFINGILQLIGPPICNIVFVHINSYGPIIMALGGALIFGAAVWGYLPLSKRNNKKNQMLV